MLEVVSTINSYLSNYVLLILLIGVGLWYTVKTGFVQVRCFGEGWRRMFGDFSLNGKKSKSGMSSFQALATAIAAQVGTGNIVGASAAILTGGPGAIFWMWLIAFFGMATIYAEATSAIETRQVDENGNIQGGPVYYITRVFKGKGGKFLAGFFAVAIILSLGCIGVAVQSNSIGSTMSTAFGIQPWVMGLILVVLCAAVFLGNMKRLAGVTEKLVPVMAVLFLCGGIIILIANWRLIPAAFGAIFHYAFQPQALMGGGIGAAIMIAMTQGAKRGLFSNEAGMGSTPHAHAQANVKNPHDQGVVAMIGVFIDTFIVLTMNALVIIITLYVGGGALDPSTFGADGYAGAIAAAGLFKGNLAQTAFGTVFGGEAGAIFVAICLFFFAFSTILSWNMFGKINVQWLFGKKALVVYALLSMAFVFWGAWVAGTPAGVDLVWELQDMFNQLMVLPNALALFGMTKFVSGEARRGIAANKEAKAAAKAAKAAAPEE